MASIAQKGWAIIQKFVFLFLIVLFGCGGNSPSSKITDITVTNKATAQPVEKASVSFYFVAHHLTVQKTSAGSCCEVMDDFKPPGTQLYSGLTDSKGSFRFVPDPSLMPEESSLVTFEYKDGIPPDMSAAVDWMTPEQVRGVSARGYYVSVQATGFSDFQKKVGRSDLIPVGTLTYPIELEPM